ncbi:hypothetical protein Aperf_G00000068622 [Anoplocephala perfoliata]
MANIESAEGGFFQWTDQPPLANSSRFVNRISLRRLQLSRAKLKASSRASALLSGFAMMAMIELTIDYDEENPIPEMLLVAFTAFASLLVVVHITALMISTCILPRLECYISVYESSDGCIDTPYEKLHRDVVDIQYRFRNAPFPGRGGASLLGEVLEYIQMVSWRLLSHRGACGCGLSAYHNASKMVDSLDRLMSELEKGHYSSPVIRSPTVTVVPSLLTSPMSSRRSADVVAYVPSA